MTSLADLDQIEVRRGDGSVAARGVSSVVLLFEDGTETDRQSMCRPTYSSRSASLDPPFLPD